MKKILVALVAAGVVWFAAASPALAQSNAAVVKVPFQFIAGHKVLPAGSYRIAPQTPDWSVVCISNLDGGDAAFITTDGVADSQAETGSDSRVGFTNYHGQYFLQTVSVPGRARRVRVTRAQAENILAKLNLLTAEPANVAK